MSDILTITNEVLELFAKHDLSKAQSMFVCESVKMNITEKLVSDMIKDSSKATPSQAGIM